MKKIKLFAIVLIYFVFSTNSKGQTNLPVKLDIASFNIGEIPDDDLAILLDSTIFIFNNYCKYGTSLDKDGNPSKKVLTKFRKLFKTNTKVINDLYIRPGDTEHFDIYLEDLASFLEDGGVKYDIEKAKIEEINSDDNYYRIIVRFTKNMYQGIDEKDQDLVFYKKPFSYDLEMTISFSKYNMEDPKITNIRGLNLLKPIPDRESFFGVIANYGLPSINGKKSDFIDESTNLSNLIKGKSNISFGIDYMRNITGGQSIFWNIGVNYNILTMETSNDDTIHYNRTLQLDGLINYERDVFIHPRAKENITINSVSIPIGLYYKKDFQEYHTIFIGANISPSFTLAIKHGFKGDFLRTMKFRNYETIDEIFKTNKSEDDETKINCNGEYSYDSELLYSSKVSGYNIQGNITLKYLYRFAYNLSIAVNLNFSKSLSPILKNAEKMFLEGNNLPDESYSENTSFTQSIYKDLNASIISFGVGWYYNFSSKGLLY